MLTCDLFAETDFVLHTEHLFCLPTDRLKALKAVDVDKIQSTNSLRCFKSVPYSHRSVGGVLISLPKAVSP